jgi:hypothetical protein
LFWIEASVSSDLPSILKRIKVKDLTKDGVSCFLTNTRDAEQQLFFPGKIIILVEVRPNKLLYAFDLIFKIMNMVIKHKNHISRADTALEAIDFCLAGSSQVIQQAYKGLKFTKFFLRGTPLMGRLCAAEISDDNSIKVVCLVASQKTLGIRADPGRIDYADLMSRRIQGLSHREGIHSRGFHTGMYLHLIAGLLQPTDQLFMTSKVVLENRTLTKVAKDQVNIQAFL